MKLSLRRDVGFDIPLLPSPGRRILPSVQILISSVSAQNLPIHCPSAQVADTAASPFLASAGSKGKHTRLSLGKSCANRVLLAPIGWPRTSGSFISSNRWVSTPPLALTVHRSCQRFSKQICLWDLAQGIGIISIIQIVEAIWFFCCHGVAKANKSILSP